MFDKIAIRIQAVESRSYYITEYIVPNLESMGFKNIEVYYDHDLNGPMWNFNRIIEGVLESDFERILVLQDDIIFANHFGKHIQDLCKMDIGAISLFCPPRKKYLEEEKNGTRIYTEKNFLWIPAMLYKLEFLKEVYEYSKENPEAFHDDVLVGNYAKKSKQYVRVTIPSLIQHNLTMKSSIGTAPKIGSIVRESPIFYDVEPPYFI